MNESLSLWVEGVRRFSTLTERERDAALRRTPRVRQFDDAAASALLAALAALDRATLTAALPLVTSLLEQLTQRLREQQRGHAPVPLPSADRERIFSLYNALRFHAPAGWALLGWLVAARTPAELTALAEWLATSPPDDAPQLAAALAPLFQRADYDPTPLFPRLLDAVAHQPLAAAVLDLANFLTRSGRVAPHPAAPRAAVLRELLGSVAHRLAAVEEAPDAAGRTAQEVGQILAQSLPLAVSLCDTLALVGDREAIGKLHQTMELKHRRLRTEAAAALARLGEPRGADILVELASEPVARLRVLAYAQELGLGERIAPEFQTAAAKAESALALWLAQPAQFGLPPTRLELFDEREQHWPGFQEPVECFLFRFQYDLGDRFYANIGLAGPVEHAFAADLADLPPDDLYAAFAGWHVEHEELREVDVAALSRSQRTEVDRLKRRLHDAGFEAIAPLQLAWFFGERVLIATASLERRFGVALATTSGETHWIPRGASSRPLGPQEAYCIFKGRRLLRSFRSDIA